MGSIRVMLVDDNPVFVRATTQFLEAHEDMAVVGTARGGDEALEQVGELRPQVVLIDLAMPGLSGLATIPRMRHEVPDVGIIALTVMNSPGFREAALTAGADVFVPKASMRTDLLPAVRALAQAGQRATVGEACVPPDNGGSAPRRVLVMEDEADLRSLYARVLRAAGYEVHSAATIQETRDLLAEHRFDLLLCDVHMGDERATDLLRDWAATLALGGAQVVMVSGQSRYRDACAEMGADFFLEKPVSIGTLVALVNRLTAQ